MKRRKPGAEHINLVVSPSPSSKDVSLSMKRRKPGAEASIMLA